MTFKEKVESKPWKWLIISFGTGFSIMFSIFIFVVQYSGRYYSKNEVAKNFMHQAECMEKMNTIYILKKDTTSYISGEEMKILNDKIERIEKLVILESEVSYNSLSEEMKYTIALSELDILFGQMKILQKVINNGNIKRINDSLSQMFDVKYQKINSEYENVISKF